MYIYIYICQPLWFVIRAWWCCLTVALESSNDASETQRALNEEILALKSRVAELQLELESVREQATLKENGKIHGSLNRYVKLWVAHVPGTFSPPSRVSDPDMHHGTCVAHVPWCMTGSLTRGFPWSRWRGKRSWHSLRMRNSQFYVSGKRPLVKKSCHHY